MARERRLAQSLVELADTLVDDFDVADLLTRLTQRCVDVLQVDHAGLLLSAVSGDLRVMASSSEEVRLLALFELQTQDGPCIDSFLSGRAIINQDLDTGDGRWPEFGPRALDAGFRAVHAVPMRLRGAQIGALSLFQTAQQRLSDSDALAAQAFADIATIAIMQHRMLDQARLLNDQLTEALNSRIAIEQAKGVVAERRQVGMDEAFALLRGHARRNNLKLADVVSGVISGTVPVASLSE